MSVGVAAVGLGGIRGGVGVAASRRSVWAWPRATVACGRGRGGPKRVPRRRRRGRGLKFDCGWA